jgi:hypothetical protein
MQHESLLDTMLDLAVFVAVIAFFGTVATAILERLVGSPKPAVRRVHVVVALALLIALAAADRIYHLTA